MPCGATPRCRLDQCRRACQELARKMGRPWRGFWQFSGCEPLWDHVLKACSGKPIAHRQPTALVRDGRSALTTRGGGTHMRWHRKLLTLAALGALSAPQLAAADDVQNQLQQMQQRMNQLE